MRITQIKSIHTLRKNLAGEQLEVFMFLERAFLDVLHRQRIYPYQEALKQEEQMLWQKLRQFASKDVAADFDAPSVVGPGSNPVRPQSQDAFALPHLTVGEQYQLPPLLPKLRIDFLTRHIPISYCYHHKAETYPLIELLFDSKHLATDYNADVSVSFCGYSEPDEHPIRIPTGTETPFYFLPLIRPKYMQEVTEQCHVMLSVKIRYTSPYLYYYSENRRADFLSRNIALLWRRDKHGILIDCTPYLAAWVTPRQRTIRNLVSKVAKRLPEGQRGYNLPGNKEERRLAVLEQVEAIFYVLYDQEIIYGTSSEEILANLDSSQKVQFIRFPAEVIEHGGAANCIDGVVLFASVLEAINLHPAILLLDGHAVVGWQVFKNEYEYEFLDTVLIHKGDFQEAYRKGMSYYPSKVRNKVLNRTTFGYPALIDIAVCRSKQIFPLDM